ncbi:MAG: bifunctional demethylmenaquinone methyltransferase/2-methoxy-6-polyprenyl-1,4-benzoquinol methylase UbiE [Deltaproteobacteria bacterium]|nr:MAG: bifunctional demethylmenaquinone methyltransferase/2-methoxy-6-polyprenyl-1,4-benzoquinol methylase UbiE [Deltaproteobacteria bacterium]
MTTSKRPEAKGQAVQNMFDAIAERYDLMNRVMTMGQDQRWRSFVVAKTGDVGEGRVLDLATGTGDIAHLASVRHPQATIIGGDFSSNMLLQAKKRFSQSRIHWLSCDATNLPYAENTFDAVTFGYLLRNVADCPAVLKEIYRVVKPGGRVVCLDTTPPARGVLYPFISFYLRFVIPLLGRLLAADAAAYSYLTGSTMEFYPAETLAEFFVAAGFSDVQYKRFMLGTIGIHWATK